jgi:hypothetical protein
MPRIRTTGPESRGPATWQQTVVERIRAGKLAPILSNAVGDDLALGGHAALVEAYAAYSRYPLGSGGLAEMAQFKGITDESVTDTLALKEDYVTFVKSRLFELAEADGAGRDALDDVDAQFDHLTLAQMCDQLGCPRYGDERSHPASTCRSTSRRAITSSWRRRCAGPARRRALSSAAGTRRSKSTPQSSTAAMSRAGRNPSSIICTGWTVIPTRWC